MPPTIRVTVDDRHLRATLAQVTAAQQQAARQWLREKGESIMTEAKELCPVVTGALRSSGGVIAEAGGDQIILFFGGVAARYALRTHENPRAGRTGGVSPSGRRYPDGTFSTVGQWKWLETPFRRLTANAEGELAAVLARSLR